MRTIPSPRALIPTAPKATFMSRMSGSNFSFRPAAASSRVVVSASPESYTTSNIEAKE